MESILRRGENIRQAKNFPPIHIFPEGTTTNGKYIISYKKGAFEPLLPIKMFCLKYGLRHFNPSLDSIGMGSNYILLLS
jgi:lysophosphatidylcholine acyltransferase/lyso-PAF acetyltransferase